MGAHVFDLNLIPFLPSEVTDPAGMPGLSAAAAPRGAARGRSDELLVCMITLAGSQSLPVSDVQELVSRAVKTYFATPGSVTAALRSAADALNQVLLDRNLRNSGAGRQIFALLNLAVLRDTQVFLAHSGPTHSFALAPQVEAFHDAQLAGRGLGLTRTLSLRFYQAAVSPGSFLLFSPEPPATWNETNLAGSAGLPLENLLRRLLVQTRANLQAALVQIQAGSGKIKTVRVNIHPAARTPAASTPAITPESTPVAKDNSQPGPISTQEVSPQKAETLPVQTDPQPTPVLKTPVASKPQDGAAQQPPQADQISRAAAQPARPDPTTNQAAPLAPAQVPSAQPARQQDVQPVKGGRAPAGAKGESSANLPSAGPGQQLPTSRADKRRAPASPAKKRTTDRPNNRRDEPEIQQMHRVRGGGGIPVWFVSGWRKMRTARQNAGKAMQVFFARLLPNAGERAPVLSPFAMAFIALAVPIVIVTIALVVYFEKGQTDQYRLYFAEAQLTFLETSSQKDPKALRNSVQRTILSLDKADSYRVTDESRALRLQAQNLLDQLDNVVRLAFQPAIIGGLPKTVQVTKLLASANDLYLLDGAQGRVLHATISGRGYEMDNTFNCGPGPSGLLIVGPIVDMVPLPLSFPIKASILALDQGGNLLYCLAGGAPFSVALTAPDNNWGQITAFALDSDILYILDPKDNAIQVYEPQYKKDPKESPYSDRPRLFFTNESPPLSDAVGLTVVGQDLNLLHKDGHITTCTFSKAQIEPVRCQEPATFSDARPGQDPDPKIIVGTRFSQILYTAPPNPAIFFLDPGSSTIYQFSLRLNLNRLAKTQSLSAYLAPGTPATAFTISPNRAVFIAYGNRVFYNPLLP
jgi:hypothetical protein